MFKLVLEKAEEPEIKLPTTIRTQKKQENSRKTSTSTSLTMLKPLTVWITTNCGKLSKRWEYQTTLSASWEICIQVKKQHETTDMEQQTGSNLGKHYITVYCNNILYCTDNVIYSTVQPAYLTYMQSTSWETLGWMKHKLK